MDTESLPDMDAHVMENIETFYQNMKKFNLPFLVIHPVFHRQGAENMPGKMSYCVHTSSLEDLQNLLAGTNFAIRHLTQNQLGVMKIV